jgi:hypothetical protein|tara:strand:+ start:1294 stop:1497 length:204 start_codon:yes stop_codon:yes gene_type:complete
MSFELTPSFILAITGMVGSGLGLLLITCLKSRCSEVSFCWGLINCTRVVIPPSELAFVQSTGSTIAT